MIPVSVLEIFKIGIGPSSSHTVGPMVAAKRFATLLDELRLLEQVVSLRVELFGSLGATGKGHGTDKAILLGLEGQQPETVDVDAISSRIETIRKHRSLSLLGKRPIAFDEIRGLVFKRRESLPFHPNGMRFSAAGEVGELLSRTYYSVGGGFVIDESAPAGVDPLRADGRKLLFPFSSGKELLQLCSFTGMKISDIALANESVWRSETDTLLALQAIWLAMQDSVRRGCEQTGDMPGGLRLKRRAHALHETLSRLPEGVASDPLTVLDWVNLYALAVNEENACGGRVVTAPTNGAAGIVPAVMHYYMRFVPGATVAGIERFLLTAGALAMLYKANASLSGAEVGCQGEVGVACSIAAGALAEVCGGTPAQVENAAEIGMEHNLGLTCDPIGGLVQVPCIERNAMGAVKAINAARLALRGDGQHFVSLDKVIATMRQTGADMMTKYKETSRGGLAVNVIEC